MKYGKSLSIALAMKGIQRKDLAEKIGVVPQQVSNWVTLGVMADRNVDRVCEALDMKVSEFIALDEVK